MATREMFYGPWQVTFTKSDPDRDNSLVIYGSDAVDGRYQRRFGGDDITLEVTGGAWSIEIQSSPLNANSWQGCELKRETRYEPPDGFVVVVRGHLGEFQERWMENVVRCVYRDPDLNPPDRPDPFDFTYGGD